MAFDALQLQRIVKQMGKNWENMEQQNGLLIILE